MHITSASFAGCQHGANAKLSVNDDEISAELDEPPDDLIHSARIPQFKRSSIPKRESMVSSSMANSRKTSLLTQALLLPPGSIPDSDAEAPLLTSDGDLTSPARTNSPSPPLPAIQPRGLGTISSHGLLPSDEKAHQGNTKLPSAVGVMDGSPATDLEVGLGRKRCIKFACGRQHAAQPEGSQTTTAVIPKQEPSTNPPKRPCMLKFVCPIRPSSAAAGPRPLSKDALGSNQIERLPAIATRSTSAAHSESTQRRDSTTTIVDAPMRGRSIDPHVDRAGKLLVFNRVNLQGAEATRFHEFAGPYNGEDEWVQEQPAYRTKMTVNDTLQKENAIRKLGEEAEEEALDEEKAAEEGEPYAEVDDLNHGLSSDDGLSDPGNETDDEEGFAASDDESEVGSDYQFWTPGMTTAATSADHLEHMRLHAPRTSSNSSIESMIHVKDAGNMTASTSRRARKARQTQPVKMRPGTPELPDSTDFVCGTLDEDRPLEAAYMSCLEERRRSKHRVIPQDIDPSFPTSDPELEKDGEDNTVSRHASDEPLWVMGKPDNSDEEQLPPQRKPLSRQNTKSPMPSPKRMRSPPPLRRSIVHRSPPLRATVRRSSDHRSSSVSPKDEDEDEDEDDAQPATETPSLLPPTPMKPQKMMACHLPHRPQLTQTASLPRTPNPFWAPGRQLSRLLSGAASPKTNGPEMHSRGPIDIVTGLEKKRQRRKEKFWRQHGRNGAKDKERRCQPGKGAERMRELGLEMAGKNKGYAPPAQLMLSI
ncbi:MAG: hypothetical protein Q9179_001001 [Wetmoreana sp. 5 TL-2023]